MDRNEIDNNFQNAAIYLVHRLLCVLFKYPCEYLLIVNPQTSGKSLMILIDLTFKLLPFLVI